MATDWKFVAANAAMLAINLVYAVVALSVSALALRLLDRLVFTKVDFEEEIQRGNIAAAIFASTLLLFVAIIVGLALGR